MSHFAESTSSTAPTTGVDFSEETRLAQLKRIEELKTRIGNFPSWLNEKNSNTSTYQSRPYDQPTYIVSVSSPSTCDVVDLLDKDLHTGPSAIEKDSFNEEQSHDFEHTKANNWFKFVNSSEDTFNGTALSTQSPVDQRPSNANGKSGHCQSRGGMLSKPSAPSSNTSAELRDESIKIESEDANLLLHIRGGDSPPSSVSSALSLPKSNPPSTIPTTLPAPLKRRRMSKETKLKVMQFRPRTSIPSDISSIEIARQSVEAALSSRLNPFVLHPDEYQLLRDHIYHLHVSAYLNVRNRILRLWVRNPLVTVTPEEAAGCACGSKWLGLAQVAYEWLIRRGYINFGCVEVPDPLEKRQKRSKGPRKIVVVVGAGMSGLGCARQLEGLFSHHRDNWTSIGQEPPKVVVLEGRTRIGGRIYSHPLQNQMPKRIPKSARCTTEMGAHIITGFDHGNPLNMIIRGQLALPYYPLKDNSTLYDIDGKIVNGERDRLVEKLFNDIIDRASIFRHHHSNPVTIEGDRTMIEAGKDPTGEGKKTISALEAEAQTIINEPESITDKMLDQVPAGVDKLTGKAHMIPGSRKKVPAAMAAEAMGWPLLSSKLSGKDIDLEGIARSSEYPTLGAAMDEAVRQYQSLLNLSPQDLRLLNWHYANLEYANAANVGKLSLGGWDQDIGNEFEGEHAQVIGGYIQVPRGLLRCPWPLDLRTRKAIKHISYDASATSGMETKVICEDGEEIEASHIVLTASLGVLKDQSITFEPALPQWKLDSIDRLGFGTLNKVILVYEKPFWDVEQDMIGLLRDADKVDSTNQEEYSANRGRFYLFWNCIKTSGRPVLIALMAGDAAHQAESSEDGQIVLEVTQQLSAMFRNKHIPYPSETIVTRWGKDRFARGSYSYVGVEAHSDDYDKMAKPIGNLHFAGEATCGTHPATVHGAYISGLRAASDVLESLIGPIEVPQPLVPTAPIKIETTTAGYNLSSIPTSSMKNSLLPSGETSRAKQARLENFETDILNAIFAKLGPRPDKPGKAGANPFLLFSKDKWAEVKARCDEGRRAASGLPDAKASRNEVRAALGAMWREAGEDIKQPYLNRTITNRAANLDVAVHFHDRLAEWDAEAMATRKRYVEAHPGVLSLEEEHEMWQALGVHIGAERRAKRASGYADGEENGTPRGATKGKPEYKGRGNGEINADVKIEGAASLEGEMESLARIDWDADALERTATDIIMAGS